MMQSLVCAIFAARSGSSRRCLGAFFYRLALSSTILHDLALSCTILHYPCHLREGRGAHLLAHTGAHTLVAHHARPVLHLAPRSLPREGRGVSD